MEESLNVTSQHVELNSQSVLAESAGSNTRTDLPVVKHHMKPCEASHPPPQNIQTCDTVNIHRCKYRIHAATKYRRSVCPSHVTAAVGTFLRL